MKKVVLIISLFFAICGVTFATIQYPERLIYNQSNFELLSYPLERLFLSNSIQRPKAKEYISSCGRGYIATWEINGENKLLLSKISFIGSKSTIKDLFPNVTDEKVFANWFSGYLVCGMGEKLGYYSYLPIYGKYLLIKIISGENKGQFELNKDEYFRFRTRQFDKYIGTDEYQKKWEKSKSQMTKMGLNDYSQEEFNDYLFIFDTELPSIIVD